MKLERPRPILKPIHVVLSAILLAPLSAAELKLATLFSDHMVLQRDKAVPVWGWADAGEKITVTFGAQTKSSAANADGKWMVKLDPMPANATAQKLSVQSEKADRSAAADDVLVGEVWLGSGQSNMAMKVSGAQDFEAEKAKAGLPLIRMFTENSGAARAAAANASGKWDVCSPESVGSFSATLFFFGREVQHDLGVPVGLINSSVGGTPIESWIAAEAQAKSPALKAAHEKSAASEAKFDEAAAKAQFEKAMERWKEQAEKAKADGKPAPKQPLDPLVQRNRRGGPGGLFNGKIAPLIPYAIGGVVWYQGEANTRGGGGDDYSHQLPLLVTDWRSRWNDELPFAWVQLPNFVRPGEGWPRVREAMLKTLNLPRTGMAIAIDVGDPKNIHPKNKQEVGHRLALWALGDVYGRKVAATSGPRPAKHEVKGADVVVSFTHTNGGLAAKGGEVKGFVIAGEDRAWKPATARIQGDKVIVSSAEVKAPVAVRYAWEDNPECNLANGAGLPASPFRTDDWPELPAPAQ